MGLSQFKGKKLGICVSGGLDSKTVTKRMKEEGLDIVCFSADLAQPDEKNINDIITKMEPCGAETIIVDLKNEMADTCFDTIKCQAMYDGGYWNTTGIARAVTVKGLLAKMKDHGCNILVHGATGRGNDQMRFERYTKSIDPTFQVYAPWRDADLLEEFPGRTEMADYLNKFNIEAVPGMKKKYSTDANLAGLSHEAEDLESLETSCRIVDPIMGVWPEDAPDETETFTVKFVKGEAVEINGNGLNPLDLMTLANEIGGRNGIWMKNALENRIIGTKSRGVYEAPGMELIGTCLRSVYQAVLDRKATKLFWELSSLVSDQIYDGRYFDPATQAARVAIKLLADKANGIVEVGLYKGNIYFNKLTDCQASLYNEADSSMEASDGLNPVSSQGFADILSVEAISLAKANQINTDIR
ncbi:MAG: argininosuccinate synthase [Planctomycetota bacterium]|nr:MAG: argininosuccinate synthase [Planctomycetota bacterium]